MDKMREEFEGWVRRRGGDVMKRDRDYISSMTREWWQAWQASRQALVVKLHKPQYGVDYGYEIHEVRQLLSDAGIKCT